MAYAEQILGGSGGSRRRKRRRPAPTSTPTAILGAAGSTQTTAARRSYDTTTRRRHRSELSTIAQDVFTGYRTVPGGPSVASIERAFADPEPLLTGRGFNRRLEANVSPAERVAASFNTRQTPTDASAGEIAGVLALLGTGGAGLSSAPLRALVARLVAKAGEKGGEAARSRILQRTSTAAHQGHQPPDVEGLRKRPGETDLLYYGRLGIDVSMRSGENPTKRLFRIADEMHELFSSRGIPLKAANKLQRGKVVKPRDWRGA